MNYKIINNSIIFKYNLAHVYCQQVVAVIRMYFEKQEINYEFDIKDRYYGNPKYKNSKGTILLKCILKNGNCFRDHYEKLITEIKNIHIKNLSVKPKFSIRQNNNKDNQKQPYNIFKILFTYS